VVLESTGVYWKPVWHMLEGQFELTLANAMHVRNVPGRKSDMKDARWLADLLAMGLIRSSFVPPGRFRSCEISPAPEKIDLIPLDLFDFTRAPPGDVREGHEALIHGRQMRPDTLELVRLKKAGAWSTLLEHRDIGLVQQLAALDRQREQALEVCVNSRLISPFEGRRTSGSSRHPAAGWIRSARRTRNRSFWRFAI
jgi:hypothetical protein